MSGTRVRRQNHSCEQCRHSRKACDGYALNISPSDAKLPLRPCSYCTRTRKQCSFNAYWGETRPTERTLSASSGTSQPGDHQSVPDTKRPRVGSAVGAAPASSLGNPEEYSIDTDVILNDMLQSLVTPSPVGTSTWQDPALHQRNTFTASPSYASESKSFGGTSDCSYELDSLQQTTFDTQQSSYQTLPQTQTPLYHSLGNLPVDGGIQSLQPYQESLLWFSPNAGFDIPYYQPNTAQPSISNGDSQSEDASVQGSVGFASSNKAISPYHTDHGMMTSMNNTLITDSLLGIYHDVLENNLACWLAEDNCPYKGKTGPHIGAAKPRSLISSTSIRQACSATWSNRIYGRVVQLDRMAQKTGQLSLTRSENRAATKALSLAIMAFATQWSQGMRRSADYLANPLDSFTIDGMSHNAGDEFEENVKNSTWEQARQALQECSDLESYRVVYAELIFGLVQKPIPPQRRIGGNNSDQNVGFPQRKREVMKMLAIQNQPTYVERATRKVHSMKFRLDAAETGFSMFGTPPAQLMAEDRSTIGLLYWLAVMLDTVSSSISEKPVALVDEDCQHEALLEDDDGNPVNRRWQARLFVQDDLDKPALSLHWPCNYHDCAEGVARSAPVKVLLFRYVSYLQNALRKRDSSQAIEDVIGGALLLYRYWNTTYGAFFQGLIRDYNTLPSRIKSWFVCILVPWNLGALMLADLIEFVDQNHLGLEQHSRLRNAGNLHSTIRKRAADELADIAEVTTPVHHSSAVRQLPDLHFAVNRGSLLTEPWTILLVNAFSKAALYHLELLNNLETNGDSTPGANDESVQVAVQHIDSCARCLWFLGRKTSVAGDIAGVFLEAIQQYKIR